LRSAFILRHDIKDLDHPCSVVTLLAPSLRSVTRMSKRRMPVTPDAVSRAIEDYLAERQAEVLPSGELAKDGRRFSWCGDVLEFLTEGLAERLAARGITFTESFPGPFQLMDEEQLADGRHIRRFWTTALLQGCPIARLCTYFFHRHDQVPLPQPPRVVAYPADHPDPEEAA
jgi:hypothetical protein